MEHIVPSNRRIGVGGPAKEEECSLVLGFATDLIKSKMEKPEHLNHAREAFREVLGTDLGLTCVVSSSVQGGRLENLGGLEDDGMVAVAVRDLGGEIVDIQ